MNIDIGAHLPRTPVSRTDLVRDHTARSLYLVWRAGKRQVIGRGAPDVARHPYPHCTLLVAVRHAWDRKATGCPTIMGDLRTDCLTGGRG